MKNKIVLLTVGAVVLLIAGFFLAKNFYKKTEAERIGFLGQENFHLFAPEHAVRKGNKEAKVVVVEFFDPECESCREFHPIMHSIMSDYEGKIQLVMRYAPFHGNSIFAIKILEAARKQDKYWEALEILFQHQPEWGSHHNPRPELIWNYLPRLGIDVEAIKKTMDDGSIQQIIAQDQKDGQQLGVRGTPTFFVNGKQVQEFGPDPLRAAIDQALKEI